MAWYTGAHLHPKISLSQLSTTPSHPHPHLHPINLALILSTFNLTHSTSPTQPHSPSNIFTLILSYLSSHISHQVNQLDNRASNFYIALYWSEFMAEVDPEYQSLATQLKEHRKEVCTLCSSALNLDVTLALTLTHS